MRRLAGALLATLAAAAPAAADSYRVADLQPISGRSPFTTKGCGVSGPAQSHSEAEPYVAADPNDPERVIATWQQDRFAGEDGGALSDLTAYSRDGGRSWHTVRLPKISRCTGGPYDRASDPWVSIGGDGTAYAATLSFTVIPALSGLAGPTAQEVSRSTSAGASWSDAVTTVDQKLYDDREAVTGDPKRPGHAYISWVRRYGVLGESGVEYFARTTDGGRSWSTPLPIFTGPSGTLPDPALVVVLPDGSLLNLLMLANGSPFLPKGSPIVPWIVMASRSEDLGQTWSAPVTIATIDHPFAPEDPDSGALVRAYPMISADVAPDGTAYVVWNENESDQSGKILLARSRDGGRGWSAPMPVAQPKTQAFIPALAVLDDGTVGVSWDDFRNDRHGDKQLTTDVWFAHSHDRGSSWNEQHLAGPFDMLTAAETSSAEIRGRFVGDYQGLAPLRGAFGAVFAQAKPQAAHPPSDIFFARIGPPEAAKGGRLRLRVRPRRVRAGRRVRYSFRVTAGGEPISGAKVSFARKRTKTNRRGRASLVRRLGRAGRYRARASKAGLSSGRASVRVMPRRARPRFTG